MTYSLVVSVMMNDSVFKNGDYFLLSGVCDLRKCFVKTKFYDDNHCLQERLCKETPSMTSMIKRLGNNIPDIDSAPDMFFSCTVLLKHTQVCSFVRK